MRQPPPTGGKNDESMRPGAFIVADQRFNSKLRDEFLNGEIFYSIKELRVLAERWRVHSNTIRKHSSLGYRSPAPQAWLTDNMGHGEVESKLRFPLPHTPDGGYLNSKIAALH